jgi:SOS-response transcriptional repressor LexA
MLSTRVSVTPQQNDIDRPTRDRILIAMRDDEKSGNKRGVIKLARALNLSKGAVGDQLKILEHEEPPLVQKEKRGRWELTKEGRDYADSCLPQSPERDLQDSGLPFLGLIGAGEPTVRIDNPLDFFSFPELNSNEYFVMRVRGDSMVNEHICDGDIVILRNVSGWDGWDNIASGDIIAAAVSEGANVHLPDWLDRVIQSMEVGDLVSDLPLDHVTLKKLDNRMKTLIGRYGVIKTVFKPIGVLAQVYRQYNRITRYRKIA